MNCFVIKIDSIFLHNYITLRVINDLGIYTPNIGLLLLKKNYKHGLI